MRMRNNLWIVISLATLINTGCGWFAGQPGGGVAVVDLDEVAKQLGANEEIAQALKAREVTLNTQLQAIQTSYVQQLKERKELYGEQPTDAQSAQLVSISRQVNLNLVNAQRQAASDITSHRARLVLKFREQVSPVAQQIAKDRGLSVVVPKNDGWLLSVDDSVNITDAVATQLKTTWQPITAADITAPQQPNVIATQPGDNAVQPASHYEASQP